MKFLVRFLAAIVVAPTLVLNFAFAADTQSTPAPADNARSTLWVRAEIRKIDPENNKVTLRHEPLTQLSMGAMTMVFRVDDPTLLQHQIAQAADAQERGKVGHLAPMLQQLVIQLADELTDRQAIALTDFFQHLPEQALQSHAGRHAMQA